MATKKKLLQAAAGTAAASGGAGGGLDVEDVFAPYIYRGKSSGGTFKVIENGINLGQSGYGTSVSFNIDMITDTASSAGDVDYVFVNNNNIINFGTGDFTVEFWAFVEERGTNTFADFIGGGQNGEFGFGVYAGTLYYGIAGISNVLSHTYYNTYTNKWTHVALSKSGSTARLFLDGIEVTNSNSDSSNHASSTGVLIGKYTTRNYSVQGYMSNVRVVKGTGLYSSNFSVPTSDLTAVTNTVLLTFQGDDAFADNSTNAYTVEPKHHARASTFGPFTSTDTAAGGMVWTCPLQLGTYTSRSHGVVDTERGLDKVLQPHIGDLESTISDWSDTFNHTGFTFAGSGYPNEQGVRYQSWTFRKAAKFFDIQTWSGTGGSRTISHDLNGTVGCIIFKRRDSNDSWWVVHRASSGGFDTYYTLDTNSASNAGSGVSNVTSSSFDVSTYYNGSGSTWVAYIFAHNDGDGTFTESGDQDIIKCGIFSKDGSGNASVDLGFEPQYILTKAINGSTSVGDSWLIADIYRGANSRLTNYLRADIGDDVDLTNGGGWFVPKPKGFDIVGLSGGSNHIYIAIRRPTKVATKGTEVFTSDDEYQGILSIPQYGTDWPVDFWFRRYSMTSGTDYPIMMSRVTGNGTVYLNTTAGDAIASYGGLGLAHMNGGDLNGVSSSQAWLFKRSPKAIDCLEYKGDGSGDRKMEHNLGVQPEMLILRPHQNGDYGNIWHVWHKDFGHSQTGAHLNLNSNVGLSSATGVNPVHSFDADGISPNIRGGGTGEHNKTNVYYNIWMFATLDGVTKVGSFNKVSGVALDVDCGFSNGCRFLLIKQTDGSHEWNLFDFKRGIVSGNDPFINLSNRDANNTSFNSINPLASGFTLNASGYGTGNFIFLAIA